MPLVARAARPLGHITGALTLQARTRQGMLRAWKAAAGAVGTRHAPHEPHGSRLDGDEVQGIRLRRFAPPRFAGDGDGRHVVVQRLCPSRPAATLECDF